METAIVGIVGALIGILLSNALRVYFDWRLRQERIRDIQTALRAEIRSQRHNLEDYGDVAGSADVLERIQAGDGHFTPYLARMVGSFIFEAVVKDIHVLPGSVIDSIVLYYRQIGSLIAFVEEMKSPAFQALSAERKAAIYGDYTALGTYALELSDRALLALNQSLKDEDDAQ